jgi:peptide/histidine transporter 3/4
MAITRMLPIFISSLLIYLPFTLLMTLTIQVGSTMDKRAGTIQIPSASLIAIPTAFHMLMQPFYSRILRTTPLQRIGAGSVCGTAAACVATLVEVRRLAVAEQHGLTATTSSGAGGGVPMSVFWLLIQFFLLSVMDAACFSGLVEFVRSEAPPAMKPIAPAVQSFLAGLAAWSCCAFVQLVNRATRAGGDGCGGWLDGTNFNRTRLDHFFLLLAVFELLASINYAFWARRHARKQQRICTVGLEDDN